jgi:hypothetical protein
LATDGIFYHHHTIIVVITITIIGKTTLFEPKRSLDQLHSTFLFAFPQMLISLQLFTSRFFGV